LVKFRERKMKKHYKRKDYGYRKWLMEFPVRVSKKIEPHKHKKFDHIDITFKETATQEFLTISLGRNKTREEIHKEKTV